MEDSQNPYEQNPYESPRAQLAASAVPGVWTGYVVYCVLMALMYLCVVLAGVVLGMIGFSSDELGGSEFMIYMVVMIAVGGVLFIPYAVAPFLPKKPWTWILGIVLIGIGLTSCLTMPFSIPLLIFWLKPEAQAFFGRQTTVAPQPAGERTATIQ